MQHHGPQPWPVEHGHPQLPHQGLPGPVFHPPQPQVDVPNQPAPQHAVAFQPDDGPHQLEPTAHQETPLHNVQHEGSPHVHHEEHHEEVHDNAVAPIPVNHQPAHIDPEEAWPLSQPDMPKIVHLDVKCEKNLMKVVVEFDRPFNGLIFSKGNSRVHDDPH